LYYYASKFQNSQTSNSSGWQQGKSNHRDYKSNYALAKPRQGYFHEVNSDKWTRKIELADRNLYFSY